MRRKILEGNYYIPYKLIKSLANPQTKWTIREEWKRKQ